MSQIKKKFIGDNEVGAAKIRLENDSALKARNAADSGDVDLIKLNALDEVVITGLTAPSNNTDAATKLYVDDFSASLASYIGDVEADVNDLITLSGVASGSEDLGSFSGNIIPDNSDIKEALQALETAIESEPGANKTLSNLTSPTAINQHLLPDTTNTRNLGSALLKFGEVHGSAVYGGGLAALLQVSTPRGQTEATLSGTDGGIDLAVVTGNRISSNASRQVSLQTGNTVNGNSGDILLRTGVPSGTGVRGKVDLSASELDMNAVKIVDLADPTNAQDAATKAYVDAAVGAASAYRKEQIQLSGGQITAQEVTLAQTPLANSIMLFAGGLCQLEGVDFSLSGSTVTFLGDLATGGASELVAGDYLVISYAY